MIDLIILDLDGPILDGKLRHYNCYSDILYENGFVPMSLDHYWKMKRNRRSLHEQLKISGADAIREQFLQLWLERIESRKYLEMDILQPGAVEKLCKWKVNNVPFVLVTMRNNSQNLHWQLDFLDILNLFDKVMVVGSNHDGSRKAEAVQKNIQFNPSRGVWIGDTETDVVAARQLGVPLVVVTCGLRSAEYLKALCPNYLLPDLQSICLEKITPCL